MNKNVVVEQHINFDKSIFIMVYKKGKLVEYYDDCSCKDVQDIFKKIKEDNKDSSVEYCCYGELCTGGWVHWKIEG